MQKFVRSLALVASLTLAAAPAIHAEQTGCNPHPNVARSGGFAGVVYTVLSYFGL